MAGERIRKFSLSAITDNRRNSTTRLVRMIRGEPNVSVTGLAILGNHLYVVTLPTHQQVAVYDATTFDLGLVCRMKVEALHDDSNGLAACPTNNCVYISDWDRPNGNIHRIQAIEKHIRENGVGTGNRSSGGGGGGGGGQPPENAVVIKSWRARGMPYGLSLTAAGNLLVVICISKSGAIVEYTKDGSLVREIFLKPELAGPLHALQLANGQYLVSHCSYENAIHRVCFIDAEGEILMSYGYGRGSAIGQLNEPRQVAFDNKTGYVYVADKDNDRVVVLHLSRTWWRQELTLNWSRDIIGPIGATVSLPLSLFLDESSDRLYVGQVNGNVLIYENVIEKY